MIWITGDVVELTLVIQITMRDDEEVNHFVVLLKNVIQIFLEKKRRKEQKKKNPNDIGLYCVRVSTTTIISEVIISGFCSVNADIGFDRLTHFL